MLCELSVLRLCVCTCAQLWSVFKVRVCESINISAYWNLHPQKGREDSNIHSNTASHQKGRERESERGVSEGEMSYVSDKTLPPETYNAGSLESAETHRDTRVKRTNVRGDRRTRSMTSAEPGTGAVIQQHEQREKKSRGEKCEKDAWKCDGTQLQLTAHNCVPEKWLSYKYTTEKQKQASLGSLKLVIPWIIQSVWSEGLGKPFICSNLEKHMLSSSEICFPFQHAISQLHVYFKHLKKSYYTQKVRKTFASFSVKHSPDVSMGFLGVLWYSPTAHML